MRRFVYTLPLLLLLFGCASIQEKGMESPAVKREVGGREEETEEVVIADWGAVKEPVEHTEITKEVMLLSKESSFLSNGSLDSYTLFTYQENGAYCIKEKLFTAGDELFETTVYEYAGDNLIKKNIYDAEGNLKYSRVFSYKGDLLISNVLFDRTGKVQNSSKYEYDSGGKKVKWSVYDGSAIPLAYTIYVYEDGKNVKIEIFNPSDILEGYSIIEYDSSDNKVKESFFVPNGELEKYTEYTYENTHLISEHHFKSNGIPVRKVLCEYDEQGNVIRVKHVDALNRVKEIMEREYARYTIKNS